MALLTVSYLYLFYPTEILASKNAIANNTTVKWCLHYQWSVVSIQSAMPSLVLERDLDGYLDEDLEAGT